MEIGSGINRTAGIRHRAGHGAVTRDDAGHMRAVSVRIQQTWRVEAEHAVDQIGMRRIHAGVVHIYRHIFSVESEIVGGGDGVGGNPEARAREIIGQHAAGMGLDPLYPRNSCQRRHVLHIIQNHLHAGRGRRFRHRFHAQFFQLRDRLCARVREDQHVHRRVARPALQRPLE